MPYPERLLSFKTRGARYGFALALIAVLLTVIPAPAADKPVATPTPTPAPKEPAAAQPASTEAFQDVPMGQDITGLRIPHYNRDLTKLLMLFDIGIARRIDNHRIEMENLKIEIHNDDGSTFHVKTPKSVFDLDTSILTSDTPTEIRREDFVIAGDAAEFNTKTRFGRMTGKVKMTIFNTDKIE